MTESVRYRVGIDVGSRSLGFCAVAIDENDFPIELLNSMVLAHDGGLDPGGQKAATTRLAVSGVARRTRRLIRRRKKRLASLDDLLDSWGWTGTVDSEPNDPYFPWQARAQLVEHFIADPAERAKLLGVAMRHIARHRGWRSPYSKVESLLRSAPDSDQLQSLRERVVNQVGSNAASLQTQGQLVAALNLSPTVKVRGPEGILQGKFMQSDNANEIRLICETQRVDPDKTQALIVEVFKAKSPKGAQRERVGKDPLPGQHNKFRAQKAEVEFQHYRIAALLGNLRIKDGSEQRPLSTEEKQNAFAFLSHHDGKKELTWDDLAELFGIARENMRGTATQTADGDRAGARPPVDVTNAIMLSCKAKPVAAWWKKADAADRAALVRLLSNSTPEEEVENPEYVAAEELLASLDETDMENLEKLTLPVGRAAYSTDSLQRLTDRMLIDGVDLHEARKREFGVDDSWRPPAAPIGEQTGNPAVDRVMKGVARWLIAAERKWGVPVSVNIEHVRDGFMSVSLAREFERELKKREDANLKIVKKIHEQRGSQGYVSRSDILRFQAFTRQNSQCLYCGEPISLDSLEMDHIVPRAGVGSTNRRDNLVAICSRCNASKSKKTFSVWAETCGIPGVSVKNAIDRVRLWVQDPGLTGQLWTRFTREVIARLKRTTEDPELDGRSMESVAWMATELQHRISQHWRDQDVKVGVYRGQLTAEARRASGFEGRIHFIGGSGKTRLDRRHHAMDAACIALMKPRVAEILAQRINLRDAQRIERAVETWKEWQGKSKAEHTIWSEWIHRMIRLAELFDEAIVGDRVPVMENLRLRLGNSSAHDDTVRGLHKHKLGDEFTQQEMDRASTPALWTALSREHDFELGKGLPANPNRTIRVNGTRLATNDDVLLFPSGSASMLVRGGAVEIGNAIHHGRIYRIHGKKPSFGMVRVFQQDLLRHASEDLFSVELPPQSVSMRDAHINMRKALAEGRAEYLGWIVVGDEILVTPPRQQGTSLIDKFAKSFPETRRWRLNGFYTNDKLRLRPVQIASEGLSESSSDAVRKIVDRPGWVPAVNMFWNQWQPVVIRRTTLGEPRIGSSDSMPKTWYAQGRVT